MITYCKGDIFESEAGTLVNPVNTMGVAGKGLAKVFKVAYPESYKEYRGRCRRKELRVGVPFAFPEAGRLILFIATKTDWREPSKMGYVIAGIKGIIWAIAEFRLETIAIPALGCGEGGLEWNVVKATMEASFMHLNCNIEIYEPR
jgi:O-acetyl-ADP-ribose deacetylase (regulator of RNase III)